MASWQLPAKGQPKGVVGTNTSQVSWCSLVLQINFVLNIDCVLQEWCDTLLNLMVTYELWTTLVATGKEPTLPLLAVVVA